MIETLLTIYCITSVIGACIVIMTSIMTLIVLVEWKDDPSEFNRQEVKSHAKFIVFGFTFPFIFPWLIYKFFAWLWTTLKEFINDEGV